MKVLFSHTLLVKSHKEDFTRKQIKKKDMLSRPAYIHFPFVSLRNLVYMSIISVRESREIMFHIQMFRDRFITV